MLKNESELLRGVSTPVHRDDHRCVMGLAARADDLITHYPDLADSREAHTVV
jgi:hypothetical protein